MCWLANWLLTPQWVKCFKQIKRFQRFLSIYAHTIWRRTTKFNVVTHMGRGLVFRWSSTPHQKGAGFQSSGNLKVLLYLCLYPLTQNDQIRHGNTYGAKRVSCQPRHCICTNASRGLSAIEQAVREADTICPALQVDLWPFDLESGVPILVFLGLSFLDSGPMYAKDRETSDKRQTRIIA